MILSVAKIQMTAGGGICLSNTPKYYIVEASVLPEVFTKTIKAKAYLSSGKAKQVSDAVRMAGISRSAFYKYKDAVAPFNNMSVGHIITFSMMLVDAPGVLSSVLGVFAKNGANILTINQTIPAGGVAPVTISAETEKMNVGIDRLISRVLAIDGVMSCEPLAGE